LFSLKNVPDLSTQSQHIIYIYIIAGNFWGTKHLRFG